MKFEEINFGFKPFKKPMVYNTFLWNDLNYFYFLSDIF
jgi:hypothetical protein